MKRLTYVIAVLLLTSFNLQAQWIEVLSGKRGSAAPTNITVDNTTPNHTTGVTNSFPHVQGSLTHGYVIIVASFFYFADNTATATYDGVSIPMLVKEQRAGGVSDFVYIFGKALDGVSEDGGGTKTVTVTLAGGGGSFAFDVGVTTFNNVNQSATFTTGTGTNSDASPTCTVSTAASTDMVICGVEAEGAAATITCGDTLLWSFNGPMCSGGSRKAGTGGSVTSTWTLSGARDWATAAVVLTL